MKYLILFLIRVYQKTLSPDHGLFKNFITIYKCRFYPTCSEYCYQAIDKHGFLKGFFLGVKRIKRCSPKHDGGYDPLK